MRFNAEMASKFGGRRRQAALTEIQIREVFSLFLAGETGINLAKRFGVGKSTIYRIVSDGHFADITRPEGV